MTIQILKKSFNKHYYMHEKQKSDDDDDDGDEATKWLYTFRFQRYLIEINYVNRLALLNN